jgi:Lrp/AsnC family transcriptional regulator, regulator for asnA, asnC and gidA
MSESVSGGKRPAPVSLDELDKAILRQLQDDGRMSYTDLGAKVGLSAPATRQRVQRLIAQEVLQVVGVTDPLRLGLPVMAMLGIRAEGDLRELADRIGAEPAVIYVVHTAGTFDLLVEVVCREPSELLDIVNDRIGRLEGVKEVEKMVYLDIHTHRFDWEVP